MSHEFGVRKMLQDTCVNVNLPNSTVTGVCSTSPTGHCIRCLRNVSSRVLACCPRNEPGLSARELQDTRRHLAASRAEGVWSPFVSRSIASLRYAASDDGD